MVHTCLIGLLGELSELKLVNPLQQWLAHGMPNINICYVKIKTFVWEACERALQPLAVGRERSECK